MAGYKDHFFAAALVGVGIGSAGHLFFGIDAADAILGGVFALLGGLLPDIDSDASISLQRIAELAALFATIALLVAFPSLTRNISTLIVVILGSHLILQKAIPSILRRLTVHRGMMHSIPAAVISGEVVFLAVAVMLGVLTHLLADEWAARGKRSFGTALSFRTKRLGPTLFAYLLLTTLSWWIWKHW